jgi:DNA-binding transcriptional LysR family regulator
MIDRGSKHHSIKHTLADDPAVLEVAGFRARPRGLLKINTGNAFGYRQLMPALPEFLARHPDLSVQLSFADTRVDLIDSGDDVAVRTGVFSSPSSLMRQP